MKKKIGSSGFSVVETLLIAIIICAIGFVGWFVWQSKKGADKSLNAASNTSTTASKKPATSQATTSQSQPYLYVNELGIKFKLSSPISDAYYAVKSGSGKNGKPIIALYVHSLDKYKNCSPSNNSDGVAEIATYTEGYKDEIVGDYNTGYPNSPSIDGLHYYISMEQYDCSGDGTTSSIHGAFKVAYPTIVSAMKEFAIPELGIKMTLPDGLTAPDLEYSITVVQGSPVAYFTTDSLQKADAASNCGLSSGALGTYSKLDQDANVGSEAEKKVGQYYILYQHPQGLCTAKAKAEQLESTQINLLRQAFQSVSAIN